MTTRKKTARPRGKAGAIRTILFATDLSARSDRAFHRALALARALDAGLTIVHVIDGDLPAPIVAKIRAEAGLAIARDLAAADANTATGARTNVRIEAGDAYEAILRCAEQVTADLIVLGTHRPRPLADLFVGTTVERVARLGACPVLVVKDRAQAPYRHVLAAVDFSPNSANAIRAGGSVAPGASITLVHGYQIPFVGFLGRDAARAQKREAHERSLAQRLEEQIAVRHRKDKARELRFLRPILKEGPVSDVVAQAVRRTGADLLVLGTHSRSLLGKALLGSVAAGFLNRPPCDVLVVPLR